MKFCNALCCALPILILACSSDDSDSPASSAGTSGAGGGATASAGAPGNGGAGAGAAGANAAAGSAGANAAGNSEGGSGTVPLDEPGDDTISGGTADAGAEPAPVADAGSPPAADGDTLDDGTMTFFVTSAGLGDGGNLGGLDGADAFCAQLAVAQSADFGRRTWRAYLSTADADARDRIGTGPWRNQAGVVIANDLDQLHDQAPGGTLDALWPAGDLTVPLDEQGNQVPNNVHDILTGSQADGTLDPGLTCDDWTSNVADPAVLVRVGHSNRMGGGQAPSWSTTHTVGCSQDGTPNITQGGGRGSVYCFAVITGE